jgi:hypothetical protein
MIKRLRLRIWRLETLLPIHLARITLRIMIMNG